MDLVPSTDYRFALRKGDRGTDVAALQINLVPTVDGIFGKRTKHAVSNWQQNHSLEADGIAGLLTQQSLCVELSRPAATRYKLPGGMLKSLISNESGFAVAAVSRHPSDAGLDIGAYQRSTGAGAGNQAIYQAAYDITNSAESAARNLRETRAASPVPVASRYLEDMADGDVPWFQWQMAVLNHNWPYAAQEIPKRGHIFNDAARDDQPAAWIETASAGRLHTPREWVMAYVARATVFVQAPNKED